MHPIEQTVLSVAGDFGFYWDKSIQQKANLQKLAKLPFEIAVVLGNHENYEMIENERKKVIWNGNEVWQMSDNVYIMPDGVIELQGKTILCARGADSIDKDMRIPYIEWWHQEQMSVKEQIEIWNSSYWYHNSVDYVITHSAPSTLVDIIFHNTNNFARSSTEKLLDLIAKEISFKKWYCGHYHIDITMHGKFEFINDDLLSIEKGREEELRWIIKK